MAFQRKELPVKYYLDHFTEFLGFIRQPCQHLLGEQELAFISCFEKLEQDAQCLLVRTANRKSPYIPRHTLYYNEIADTDRHFETLFKAQLLRPVAAKDVPAIYFELTKPQLVNCLKINQVAFKASESKSALVEIAAEHLSYEQAAETDAVNNLVVRNYDDVLDYLLFLFFGDVSSRLNKFSMRDLGVMQTRSGEQAFRARFEDIKEAKSTFFYRKTLRQIGKLTSGECHELFDRLDEFPAAIGDNAISARNKLLLQLGQKLNTRSPEKAVHAWSLSNHPDAQAKWIRAQYKAGEKDRVLDKLNQIIEDPESEHILLFAEDFLARKYDKKRTSKLTDMLRENSHKLPVDEIYRDDVESGVISHLQCRDQQAWHTENSVWRMLFGLCFWQELHETDQQALATEFDWTPRSLKANDFYQQFGDAIEARLRGIQSTQGLIKHLTSNATRHYGKNNSIFWWSNDVFDALCVMLTHASLDAIKDMLRAICSDYKTFRDGYPDLMVIDHGKLRFEEVKAPGDQLRRNQLMTINRLRKAGFDARITQVEWIIDPAQPYVVVDIETTGGAGNYDRITEIGAVKMIAGEQVDSWQSLLNPQRHIPSTITRLTGIDDDMVVDAPLFSEVADSLRCFMQGCVFVAHNVNFDYGFIKKEYERIDQKFKMPKLCTVREMRKAVPGLASYSLANLAEHFDIQMTRHHRAMSDAVAAAELLQIINHHRLKSAEMEGVSAAPQKTDAAEN